MENSAGTEKKIYFPENNVTIAETPAEHRTFTFANHLTLVLGKLNPLNNEIYLLSDDCLQSLIDESEIGLKKARELLTEALIGISNIKDKQQFIQMHQALLIRLLDKLHAYRQNKQVDDRINWIYSTVSSHLQNTLDFIEEFFDNYFDRNEKVPAIYLSICKDEIFVQVEKFQEFFANKDGFDKSLINIITQSIQQFCNNDIKPVSYLQMAYQKNLLNELTLGTKILSTQIIRETLYHLNFNEDNFIDYEYEKLIRLIEVLCTNKEKINLLRFEKKRINQLTTKLNYYYTAATPSLKEQINIWIDEEIKFLENADLQHKPEIPLTGNGSKIDTSLSVAKLALIIRLMVIDKIIINRTVAPMLRVVAKMFTTLQKDEISFGSLETKYHAPEKASINSVKDMLFKWINILNKL